MVSLPISLNFILSPQGSISWRRPCITNVIPLIHIPKVCFQVSPNKRASLLSAKVSKSYVAKDFSGKMYTLSVSAVVRLNYTESVPENNVKRFCFVQKRSSQNLATPLVTPYLAPKIGDLRCFVE